MSKGSLELPLNIQMLNNEGEVALSWGDNSGVGNASDTDFAMPWFTMPTSELLSTTWFRRAEVMRA